MVFNNLLNPVLDPLLSLPSIYAIIILSVGISLIITLITKFTTNQNLMKQLKGELKELQAQMKKLRDKPDEMMKVNKKMMEINGKYMTQSMKSMLFTFIPIIIIFGWMNAHLAFDPISPGQDFTVKVSFENGASGEITLKGVEGITIQGENTKIVNNSQAIWVLQGQQGEYLLEFDYNGKSYFKEVLITNTNEYRQPIKNINEGDINTIEVEHKKNVVLNLFGWNVGWLGAYIIFSIFASIIMRKLLKVY